MRFNCDACNAQYMISDEKVGPNGVKVRCKKCGHIILVKRASEEAAAPLPPAPAPPSGDGLDVELGQAFDKVLGQTPPPAGDLPAPAAAPAGDGAAGAAPVQPAAGPGNEWYVAVDDQQVGPLAAEGVKGKWESGEIGPDSLVWKPGLEDWKPLSQVPELQQFLAPVPRPSGRLRPAARPPTPNLAAPAAAAPASKEPEWKPTAANALAALASEEMATMKAPEPARPAPAASGRPGGKSSLVDAMNLPEGGVDPTAAIPLPIKGMEKTDEKKLERKSSVARTTAELRIKRSANRTILLVAVVMLLVLGGAVGGVFWYFEQRIPLLQVEPSAPPQASRTFAPPVPAPAPPPPAAQGPAKAAAPPAVAPQAAAPPAAAPPAAASPPAAPAATPPPAPAASPPAPAAAAPPKKRAAPAVAQAEKPAPKKVAQAEPPPAPAPTPAPTPPKKKASSDPFEAGGADDEFAKLLAESPKRSVYVPPAPGGDVQDKVSTGQIQEAVAGKMAALRDCLAKQQASDPEAHGEVTVSWDIEPDGRPAAVSTGKAQNQPFAQCLVGVVKSIHFPKSRQGNKGEDKVRFPFRY
ncbi:MAG TPA: GYF domain-containing protein [Anaeromyxobacteraceae bacterium]|nr:GYF domain-containing protein [Anaeromyxobacteraceae bacterium]